MEFFASLLPQPPRERSTTPPIPEWVHPPHDEVPVAVPMVRRLARVPGMALSLRRFDVYRTGVGIKLRLDLRREPGLKPERWDRLSDLVQPHGHRAARAGQLRLGVSLADGTRADADTGSRGFPDPMYEPPEAPQLMIFGGSGGGNEDYWTSEISAWLWPLPPTGPANLHFICEGAGIAEGSFEFEAALLLAERDNALDVWAD